jgi:hypothetical protein
MSLTLAEASTQVGVNRSTLLRAIKSGKMSGIRDDAGAWHVEPVELFRVFAPVPASEQAQSEPQHASADVLVAELRAQLARMERALDDIRQDRDRTVARLDSDIADMRRERDEWREQFKRLSLPMPAAATPAAFSPVPQGSSDAGELFPTKALVRDAACPAAAVDAAQPSRLMKAWRWMRAAS